jgi:hypothetical protein
MINVMKTYTQLCQARHPMLPAHPVNPQLLHPTLQPHLPQLTLLLRVILQPTVLMSI